MLGLRRVLLTALCTAALATVGACEPTETAGNNNGTTSPDVDGGTGGGGDAGTGGDNGGGPDVSADTTPNPGGCSDNGDCASGEYCAKDSCGAASGSCAPSVNTCTDIWMPVCGCDGITYGNGCEAAAAGINVASEGECSAPGGCSDDSGCGADEYCAKASCDAASGACAPIGLDCTQEYAPVCGCDGNTYGNACSAGSSGVNVDYAGECSSTCTPVTCDGNLVPTDTDNDNCADACFCPDGTPPTANGCAPPNNDQALCVSTGGTWDANACGHYECGLPNDCDAVIPGCNCGSLSNFMPGVGCVSDADCSSDPCGGTTIACPNGLFPTDTNGDNCPDACKCADGSDPGANGNCLSQPTKEQLCTATGGTWDPNSCGDYMCGEAPFCDAIIPGCNCGSSANYMDGQGCVADSTCGGGTGQSCGGFIGASCGPNQFCDYPPAQCNWSDNMGECAEVPQACIEIYQPVCGCDGKTYGNDCIRMQNQVAKDYDGECNGPDPCGGVSIACPNGLVPTDTDGDSCPDACKCADGSDPDASGACAGNDKQDLCESTGGTWDPFACGDYFCGQPNLCLAIIPGCNCGEEANFVAGAGCVPDSQCKQGDFCGGIAGFPCPNGQWCDPEPATCGIFDGGGYCADVPQFCTDDWTPVCGCDGQTYSNDCQRQLAQVGFAYNGECQGTNCPPQPLCGPGQVPTDKDGDGCLDSCEDLNAGCTDNDDCKADSYCAKQGCDANLTGTCTEMPQLCPLVYMPVCGCDGNDYGNTCQAASAGQNVDYAGECGTSSGGNPGTP